MYDEIDLKYEKARAYQDGVTDGILKALLTFGIIGFIGAVTWSIIHY